MTQTLPVLAYYSIRSKQEYIYRTNAIREIVGASEIIKNAFNYFKTAGRILFDLDKEFKLDEIKDFADYDGVVLTEGGGNLIVLFKNESLCKKYNSEFSVQLLKQYSTLTPLCAFVPVDLEKNDYAGDYRALMEEADRLKRTDMPLTSCNTLPFVKMNRNTWQPIIDPKKIFPACGHAELTAESAAKYAQEKLAETADGESSDLIKNIKLLDELVTEKGEESLLAVVYADGNNMGRKIGELLKGVSDYDGSVRLLREKSKEIDDHFIGVGGDAVKKKLKELQEDRISKIKADDVEQREKESEKISKQFSWRRIVGGGDEITFICNARIALELASVYLNAVNQDGYSASAGIAVFHSHYPFAAAYKFAEQACENAKAMAKKYAQETHSDAEISMIDFHYIHSGIESDLKSIRRSFEGKYARPYLVAFDGKTDENAFPEDLRRRHHLLGDLESLAKKFSPARSSIKEMGQNVASDEHKAVMSLERICSQYSGMKEDVTGITGETDGNYRELFRLFFDLAEFYDIWFIKSEEE